MEGEINFSHEALHVMVEIISKIFKLWRNCRHVLQKVQLKISFLKYFESARTYNFKLRETDLSDLMQPLLKKFSEFSWIGAGIFFDIESI